MNRSAGLAVRLALLLFLGALSLPSASALPLVSFGTDGSGADGSGTTGSGEGSSDGSGAGSGEGSSDGSGDGSSDGSGMGSGDGSGMGSGDGSGDGSGEGSGEMDTPRIDSIAPAALRRGVTTEVVVRGAALEEVTRVTIEGGDLVIDQLVASTDGSVLRFRVGTGATATLGARDVTFGGIDVTLPDALAVAAGPIELLSLTPNSAPRGQSVTIAVAGANLDVIETLTFGDDITVDSWTATSPTRGTATVSVGEAAFSGLRSVTATSDTDVFTLEAGFRVIGGDVSLTEVIPGSGTRGETLGVRIIGTNLDALTSVGFGPRITVADFEVVSPTEAIAQLTVRQDAAAGPRDVALRVDAEAVATAEAFTVLRGDLAVVEIRPDRLRQRDATFVTIEGNNLDGLTGFDAGAGVTVIGIDADLPTSVSVDLEIADDAAVGLRDVTLTAPAGTITVPDGLLIAPYVRPQPDLRFVDRVEFGDVMIGGSGRAAVQIDNVGAVDETFTFVPVEGDTDMFLWLDEDGRPIEERTVSVVSGTVETIELYFIPTLRGRRGVRFEAVWEDPQVTAEYSVDAFGVGTNATLFFSEESPVDYGTLEAGDETRLPRLFTRLGNGVPGRSTIIEGFELRLYRDGEPIDPAAMSVELFSTADELYWGLTEIDWTISGPAGSYDGVLTLLTDLDGARYRDLAFSFALTGEGGGDAGGDAGADAGSDAGADAGTDAGTDAGADIGTDTTPDTTQDTTPGQDTTTGQDTTSDTTGDDAGEGSGDEGGGGGSGGGCAAAPDNAPGAGALALLALLALRRRRDARVDG